jgi:hypothetical protein
MWPVLVGLLEVLVRHRLLVCLARLALANLEKINLENVENVQIAIAIFQPAKIVRK